MGTLSNSSIALIAPGPAAIRLNHDSSASAFGSASRSEFAQRNDSQILSFYGHRLAQDHQRSAPDDNGAPRIGFVGFAGTATALHNSNSDHNGRDQCREKAGSGADSVSGHPNSLPLVAIVRPRPRNDEDGSSNKSIVALAASDHNSASVEHNPISPWGVGILTRISKPSNTAIVDATTAQEHHLNDKDSGHRSSGSGHVVDMELLNPNRGVGEHHHQHQQHQNQQQQQSHQQQQQQHHQAVLQLQNQNNRGISGDHTGQPGGTVTQQHPIMGRQRSSSGPTIACQDCGNQAKKDCPHMRCRTCCKSRGFECATHVRSTWVPAAKRRERQQAELAAIMAGQPVPRSKRARTLAMAGGAALGIAPNASFTSASTGSPPRSSDLNTSLLSVQDGRLRISPLPAEIKAHALFQCVRVTGLNDGQEEYAYRTVVRIGGRIFTGLLHDEGSLAEKGNLQLTGSSVAELQLGGRTTQLNSGQLIDLAGIYGTAGNSLLQGICI